MYELNSERNLITIFDAQTGKQVQFITNVIETDEHINYRSELIDVISKKKDAGEVYRFKLRWAEKIITGIQGDYFTIEGKPISSDKNVENYFAEWFAIIKRKRPDLLWKIVDHVFGENNIIVKEEQIPFVNSSVS